MNPIPAIPTVYKGITFRSRLEARWAMYFDLIGVEWHYEYEGYELPSGKYLPDFWLPTIPGTHKDGLFIEVKPEPGMVDERVPDLVKLTHFDCGVVWGNPHHSPNERESLRQYQDPWELYSFFGEASADTDGIAWDCGHVFMKCLVCGRIGFEYSGGDYWDRVCGPRTHPEPNRLLVEANRNRFH